MEYSFDSLFDKTETQLNSTNSQRIFDKVKYECDSILVIKPYTNPIKENVLIQLKNFSEVKSIISDVEYSDHFCYLIFVNRGIAIGYCKAFRDRIDFASSHNPDDQSNVGVIKRSEH
jgi:hypothetical protein